MKRCGTIMAFLLLIVSLTMLPGSQCLAADMDAEIQYLKDLVGASECIFIRNGAEYDSADALKHIMRKYRAARRHIKTTEDFIRLTATKSSLSGKPYRVLCGGREVPCADWLHDELARYRDGS
jgi:hypothetical protein